MKNIWKSLFVAALFVSCSEQMAEETVAPEVNNGKAIEFEVVEDGGRAAFFQGEGHGVKFEGSEVLGLRLVVTDGGMTSADHRDTDKTTFDKESDPFFNDKPYDYSASNAYLAKYVQRGSYQLQDGQWNLFVAESDSFQELEWVDGLENTIYAFYLPMASLPANKQTKGSDNRYPDRIALAVLSGEQVQAKANDHSHIDDYMVMSSDPQKFAANNHPEKVSIQLQNVYSIVEVTLKSEEAKLLTSLTMKTASDSPLAFTKSDVGLDATKKVSTGVCPIYPHILDDETGAVAGNTGLNEITLSLTEAAEVTAEGAKFYFVVLPGEHAAGDITLTANFVGGTYAEKQMGAIEFKMNKVYRPEVAFTAADVKLAEEIELHFDFSTIPYEDDGVQWGARSSFNNLRKYAYRTKGFSNTTEAERERATKTFVMNGYTGLEFVFSFTETGDANKYYGTNYHNTGNFWCLITLQGNNGDATETIGLPVREGYKLVRVEGQSVSPSGYWGTYVAITDTADGIAINKDTMGVDGNKTHGNTKEAYNYADEAAEFAAVIAASEDFSTVVGVSEGAMQASNGKVVKLSLDGSGKPYPWIFTIPNAKADTRYYISASGPYLCIKHLYLTYEKVE